MSRRDRSSSRLVHTRELSTSSRSGVSSLPCAAAAASTAGAATALAAAALAHALIMFFAGSLVQGAT